MKRLVEKNDGVWFTWGWGKYGQLGQGDERNQALPRVLDRVAFKGASIEELGCGFCYNVAVSKRGDVYTWGYGKHGQLGHPEKLGQALRVPTKIKSLMQKGVSYVAAGCEHTCCVTREGNVFSWGCGAYGMLGQGNRQDQYTPKMLDYFNDQQVKIMKVACGNKHTVAIGQDDEGAPAVYSWGFGGNGRLGVGDELNRLSPVRVELVDTAKPATEACDNPLQLGRHALIVDVKCGWAHSLLLSETGCVFSFGQGKHGQLGHGNTSDVTRPEQITRWIHERDKTKAQAMFCSCSFLYIISLRQPLSLTAGI